MFGMTMDSTFYRVMTKAAHLFYLTCLWGIFSIPLVTAGAATAALHTVTLKMVGEEEGAIAKSFYKAFRENLKQATILWLAMVAAVVVAGGDILFFTRLNGWPGYVCGGIFSIVLFILLLMSTIVFHLQAYWINTVKQTLLLALKFSLAYIPYSAALLILTGVMLYAAYVSVPCMIVTMIFGSGTISYVSAYIWRKILFDRLKEEREETDL